MIKVEDLIPAKHLQHLEDTRAVTRFADDQYPKGALRNTTHDHIMAGLQMIAGLPISDDSIHLIAYPFLLHDLPEPIMGQIDTVAPVKDSSTVIGSRIFEAESQAARSLFDADDYGVFVDFLAATQSLKTGQVDIPLPYGPVLAAIIDQAEGNMTFHRQAAHWQATYWRRPMSTFPDRSLTYTLEVYQKYVSHLDLFCLPLRLHQLALEILNVMLLTMIEAWNIVPLTSLPSAMVEPLQEAKVLLDYPNAGPHVRRVGAAVI